MFGCDNALSETTPSRPFEPAWWQVHNSLYVGVEYCKEYITYWDLFYSMSIAAAALVLKPCQPPTLATAAQLSLPLPLSLCFATAAAVHSREPYSSSSVTHSAAAN